MRLTSTPYSYRADAQVPDFPDHGPRTVMDAGCALCVRGARWISRNDKGQEFRIIPVQSRLGTSLMRHYGMDPTDPLSWLYLDNGVAYTSLDALIRVANRLGGVWRLLSVLRILPRNMQDKLYGLVARNRLRVMGPADLCSLPDPDIQKRLLS